MGALSRIAQRTAGGADHCQYRADGDFLMSNRRRNTKQLAQTPVVATQEFIPRSDTKMEAFSFGDPSPVLSGREVFDYLECWFKRALVRAAAVVGRSGAVGRVQRASAFGADVQTQPVEQDVYPAPAVVARGVRTVCPGLPVLGQRLSGRAALDPRPGARAGTAVGEVHALGQGWSAVHGAGLEGRARI